MLDLGTLLLVAGILTWKQIYGGWGANIMQENLVLKLYELGVRMGYASKISYFKMNIIFVNF